MGILQEYRFYLIIAVIALAAIIALFFSTQNSQELVDFNTNMKSNFAQIKGQASDNKSMYDVITIDGDTFRGMKNGQLFGLTHKFTDDAETANSSADATEALMFIETDQELDVFISEPGTFNIVFITNADIDGDGNVDLGDLYEDELNGSIGTATQKGWNLNAGGEIAYTFESAAVAKEVMGDYIPEGTLVGNSVKVPFLNN